MDFEYDMLYKYHLMNLMNTKNQYNGRNLENVDIDEPLSLFMDREPVTGIDQQFVFAVTIYLVHPITGEVLFLRQTKQERVVDEYVGLGGKARSIFDGRILKGEKILTTEALRKSIDFQLKPEDLLAVACKEVMEETSTYEKDKDGNYTSKIVIPGLMPNSLRMQDIGTSKIRLILPQKAEVWIIRNYLYPLTLEEVEFLKNISYENREGILEWRSVEETLPSMSLADQIILKNKNSNITVSEIRDKLQDFSVVRTKLSLPNQTVILLTEDSSDPTNYQGVIITGQKKVFFQYPEWINLSNAVSGEKIKK